MALKIKNPNFANPEDALVDGWKAQMQTYLQGRGAALEFVTVADLKAAFPAFAAQINEGRVELICKKLGLEFTRDNS